MARFKSAGQIINQVALEVGLRKVADPFNDADPAYEQLVGLLNSGGIELLEQAEWGVLRREKNFTTVGGDSGIYDLPDDYAYMIDQTGWDRTEDVPLFGPLSAQVWSYLVGRDLVTSTIYASFRLTEGKLYLFPQPPAEGLEINYEYISDSWAAVASDPGTYANQVVESGDTPLYDSYLVERLLKLRFLEARGFDTAAAKNRYELSLESWRGKDKSAPVLRAGSGGWNFPYLDIYDNTPDKGYG